MGDKVKRECQFKSDAVAGSCGAVMPILEQNRTNSHQGRDQPTMNKTLLALPFIQPSWPTLSTSLTIQPPQVGSSGKEQVLYSRSCEHSLTLSVPSDGLPLGDLGSTCSHPSLRYARVMYSAGHGLAPWTPIPPPALSSWPRNGVTIGDVGFLNKSQGTFRSLFNIFFDKKKEGDSEVAMPDNFTPIEPPFDQWDVRVIPDYFAKGAVVTSEGIEATRTADDKLCALLPQTVVCTNFFPAHTLFRAR